MTRLLLAVLATLAIGPCATASAATFVVDHHVGGADRYDYESYTFSVQGGAADDDLRVTWKAKALDVVDGTQPLTLTTPSPVCQAVDEHHVRCAVDRPTTVLVRGGDGNDRIALDDDQTIAVQGEGGDDVLTGGAADDQLYGGPGDDVIHGGDGRDLILGGPGHDEQHGDGGEDTFLLDAAALAEGETLDGGPGGDLVGVTVSQPGLVIDLAAHRVTSPLGTVTLSDISNAAASDGATLLGDDGHNVLTVSGSGRAEGRAGDDWLFAYGPATLLGGPGDDRLQSSPGATLDGGEGDDRLVGTADGAFPADPERSKALICGPGDDVVENLNAAPRPFDCEGGPAWFGFLGRVAVTPGALSVSLNVKLYDDACGLSIRVVTAHGRDVTRAVRTRRSGGPLGVRLPLARATLPATGRLLVRPATSCPAGATRPWRYRRVLYQEPVLALRR